MLVKRPPDGAIGLQYARSWVGRRIASRQGVPYSHALICIGDNKDGEPETLDQSRRGARIRPLSWWAEQGEKIDWWGWSEPLTEEEVRLMRSVAKSWDRRIKYDYPALLRLAFGRYPASDRRPHRMFCTHQVAEMAMVVRDLDFSGLGRPWNVTPKDILGVLGPREAPVRRHRKSIKVPFFFVGTYDHGDE